MILRLESYRSQAVILSYMSPPETLKRVLSFRSQPNSRLGERNSGLEAFKNIPVGLLKIQVAYPGQQPQLPPVLSLPGTPWDGRGWGEENINYVC